MPAKHTQASIERNCMPEPNSGCWLWCGTVRDGYGRIKLSGHHVAAHRVVYEMHRGPIPDGMVLDHLCRTPLCVNPSHLEPVTQGENSRRGLTGKASGMKQRARSNCLHGHALDGRRASGVRYCRTCARNREQEKRRALRAQNPLAPMTECRRGHPYDGVNSFGRRYCTTCHRAAVNARRLEYSRAKGDS